MDGTDYRCERSMATVTAMGVLREAGDIGGVLYVLYAISGQQWALR